MPRVFTRDEIRALIGRLSRECAQELLRQGKFGKRMTRVDFKAHKECIRKKFEAEVRSRIGALG